MVEVPKQFPDFQCLHTVQLLSFCSPFHRNKEGEEKTDFVKAGCVKHATDKSKGI